MPQRFPAGSEWRKWDLHVHVPGTKLSDGYDKKDGKPDFDRFAEILEGSDVSVFGITDYFCATESLAFIKHFRIKYPDSKKLLLVNVELRLNETVNNELQTVDLHVIFRDTVSEDKINEFLNKLNTQLTDAKGRHKPCSELSASDFESATVSRPDIRKAFEDTFGGKAEPTDYLIYLAPANNNGLRATTSVQRKAHLADEIDKIVHAIFGKNPTTAAYFLKTDRYEDKSQPSKPKPVFGGCDAHNFTDLERWLGKAYSSESTNQVITWVKADPTFEGLHQTIVEPFARVSLSELVPDAKDQYKVIRRVLFKGSTDFPEEIVFNPNLNAIIGSRSSGKSALLAHIAYAVDADYTVAQQMLATKLRENEVGPAAGLTWKAVESTVCKVEWADGSTDGGQIIYIPQNWLYQISDNPKEVTDKIRPVLESQYPSYFREQQRLLASVTAANDLITKAVTRWFGLAKNRADLDAEIKQVGDKKAITKARDEVKAQIETLRTANSLSAEDLETYQRIVNELAGKRSRIAEIGVELEQISKFVVESAPKQFASVEGSVSVETLLTPSPDTLSKPLSGALKRIIEASEVGLVAKVETAIVDHRKELSREVETLTSQSERLEADNKDLLEKHKANLSLDELVKRHKAQQDSLDKIGTLESRRESAIESQTETVAQIEKQTQARITALESLRTTFEEEDRVLDQLRFGIEIAFDPVALRVLSEPFRKNETGTFLKKDGEADPIVDVEKAQAGPAAFLNDIFTKKQRLNTGNDPVDVARRVLTATPEVRFTATLDEDRIGGFARPTMTPGKQALFALTLILGESEERWTLLIDQPEDDLDSRSIYGDIVRYLVDQKKQRQIILVTHNANLVVGADAEEVIVANRHGDDRKNKDGRTFDYLTGSLEHSEPKQAHEHDLHRMGIREHAVEILDGGEEAFQKRRDKYKI